MRKLFTVRRGAVVATLAVLAAVAGPAMTASAAAPGQLTICFQEPADVNVLFPDSDTSVNLAVARPVCHDSNIGGSINERVDIIANGQYLGSTIYNGSVGLVIVITPGPSYYAYVP
jgi:hypothetical protein